MISEVWKSNPVAYNSKTDITSKKHSHPMVEIKFPLVTVCTHLYVKWKHTKSPDLILDNTPYLPMI